MASRDARCACLPRRAWRCARLANGGQKPASFALRSAGKPGSEVRSGGGPAFMGTSQIPRASVIPTTSEATDRAVTPVYSALDASQQTTTGQQRVRAAPRGVLLPVSDGVAL